MPHRAVLPVHDVPLEELTGKLRAVWACCGGTQDPAAVKQVLRSTCGKSLPSFHTGSALPPGGLTSHSIYDIGQEDRCKPVNVFRSHE